MNNPENLYGVYDDVLCAIGWTPMVRLSNMSRLFRLENSLLAKLEFLNPSGSVKDRVAIYVIDDAFNRGRIREGSAIIEPTAGNTGLSLAMISNIRGLQTVFILPHKMSLEKEFLLRAMGSLIIRTPTDVHRESPLSYISVAKAVEKLVWRLGRRPSRADLLDIVGYVQGLIDNRDEATLDDILCMDIPENEYAYFLDQYFNKYNPIAHYETLGREIWLQTGGEIDLLVAGMGTGGTVSGVARYLKERCDVKVVGVDPVGSVFHMVKSGVPLDAARRRAHQYLVEGIGEDFIPGVLDLDVVDDVVVVDDSQAFAMARLLPRVEGILAGGSSGAALYAAIRYIKENRFKGMKAVIIFPDTGRNYTMKMYNDSWMRENGLDTDDMKVLGGLMEV
jgi:cystathionine beta-synthase